MLKEEAVNFKAALGKLKFEDIKASNGWLEKRNLTHGIREKHIFGEPVVVSETTLESGMERLRELRKGYN